MKEKGGFSSRPILIKKIAAAVGPYLVPLCLQGPRWAFCMFFNINYLSIFSSPDAV